MIKITTNISDFIKKLDASKQLVLEASEKTINATLFEMYKRVIDRTPVGNPALWKWPAPKDYNPGTLKASWRLSFNGMRDEGNGRFVSTDSIMNNHGISLKVVGGKKQAYIYNPQPYAYRVETGWSTQAPLGMLRITVAEYTQILEQKAQQYRIR